ncbi:MAG: dihydroorotate dehydrogenase [Vampirovibrionales bacterium]|nr:dihydroorotate dehydrogenase [Vampirovibrionales bacterium]
MSTLEKTATVNKAADLSCDIGGGIVLKSPILNASGAFHPAVISQMLSIGDVFGALVTKTVTPQPRAGNPQYRAVELPGIGMLNSIGLQNAGLENILEKEVPQWLGFGNTPLILSLSAETPEAFAKMAKTIEAHALGQQIMAYELNLSCPNVAKGGLDFGSSPSLISDIIKTLRSTSAKPLYAKLTPNVQSVLPMAEAAIKAGVTGLVAINTVLGLAIDTRQKKAILPRVSGGYSGPGIRPIALHHVWQLHKAFPDTPIIGVGGIETADDILQFLMAGASAVQVGTSCFRTPDIFQTLHQDLLAYCCQENLQALSQLRGIAH